jgi:hypothetical protein
LVHFPRFSRYNRGAVTATRHSHLFLALVLVVTVFSAAACTAAFGPGYTIEKQEIRVQFEPAPETHIFVHLDYQVRNTGNRPLSSLEIRLPIRRRFHLVNAQAEWDGKSIGLETSPANPRNTLLNFPEAWRISSSHTLRLSGEFGLPAPGEDALAFTADAFFLPAGGWTPELLPARGIFATGGVPPKKWDLVVRVPNGFLVHASGHKFKASHNATEQTVRALQGPNDGYPFVITGRYTSVKLRAGEETVNLWTRSPENVGALREPTAELIRAIRAYNSTFGTRHEHNNQLWIVECPQVTGCFSAGQSNYAKLIYGDNEKRSAEMASSDSVMVDIAGGAEKIAAAAAPSLASSWLGYGRNPGFFEQTPPLSALPAFAAARGLEAIYGPQVRPEIIRRALKSVPVSGTQGAPEDAAVIRAKSFLFFYGLQDRYGDANFDKALSHMLYARQGGGFELDDLIAAFEQETHQNVAEFVRRWIKHPGVPQEFRARYENAESSAASNPKEKIR